MPATLRRTYYGPPIAERDSLERYVATQVWRDLPVHVGFDTGPVEPQVYVDAFAQHMGDYWRIAVYVSDAQFVSQAESTVERLQDDLESRGIPTYISVEVWTGPWE